MISAVNEFLDDLRGGRMTEAPVVSVEQGQLQGRVVTSPAGKAFYSFQGIPYAKPPLGSLRFKAPQPPEPWEGIREATAEGNVSAQIDPLVHKQYIGDENCLFLNVYTPNLDGEFLPVMVFIHGGGFRFGSGNSRMYGGDYLVEKDVIVVTLNYRCGALGFLSLNTPEVPGNAGLKDMVQALRWIKDNIHNFGGNSGNITLFGESCGGAAVSILTASPASKHLINKGIIQSGTGLNSWAFQKTPLENARSLAKNLGCESDDVDDILEFLTATPVREIVEANDKMHPSDLFYTRGENIFAAVVEKEFPGVEGVLTEAFIDLLTSGRVAEIPIMIGSTTLEFTFDKTEEDLQTFIPDDLKIEKNSQESVAIAEQIKELYFKGKHVGVETLPEYFELLSDKLVNINTHRYVQYLIQVSNKPIYYYKFDYVGELNLTKKLLRTLGLNHAGHMDELGYLFKNDLLKDVEPTPQDVKMRERMLRLWTNFAKSGNPTPEESHYLTVTWQPVTKDNLYYLNLSNELSLGTNPDKEKMAFWDSLYSKYFKIWEHPKINNEEPPKRIVDLIVDEVQKPEPIVEPTPVPEIKEEPVIVVSEQITHEEPIIVQETTIETVTVDNGDAEPQEIIKITEEIKVLDVQQPEPEKPAEEVKHVNGNGIDRKPRPSNEIKMVQHSNGGPRDVIRANDPPEDDLPKNIGVNKFVNFFESLGGKK
ncbi:juvenile hormone esterase-like isoform X2 [Pectinophora gossypiella]|uniref:juvenile hormone esterase-like isoform X2 n=1 Tax=Pectinophora gossypiella TaxID=13191 RepID=UPI00214E65D8|nr:juvenile hormone esterase-like isoform X2 [Pectinophora gossypiella]